MQSLWFTSIQNTMVWWVSLHQLQCFKQFWIWHGNRSEKIGTQMFESPINKYISIWIQSSTWETVVLFFLYPNQLLLHSLDLSKSLYFLLHSHRKLCKETQYYEIITYVVIKYELSQYLFIVFHVIISTGCWDEKAEQPLWSSDWLFFLMKSVWLKNIISYQWSKVFAMLNTIKITYST